MKQTDPVIRPARESDADALADLQLQSARYHSDLDADFYAVPDGTELARSVMERLSTQDRRSAILVAEADGEVRGCIDIDVRSPPAGSMIRPVATAWLGVVVGEDYRGKGVGRRLLEAAEAWAAARGVRALMLDMSAANDDARRLYQHMGYEVNGLILRKRLRLPGPPADEPSRGTPRGRRS